MIRSGAFDDHQMEQGFGRKLLEGKEKGTEEEEKRYPQSLCFTSANDGIFFNSLDSSTISRLWNDFGSQASAYAFDVLQYLLRWYLHHDFPTQRLGLV